MTSESAASGEMTVLGSEVSWRAGPILPEGWVQAPSLLRLFSMDLRFRPDPAFDDPEEVLRFEVRKLCLDPEDLRSAWTDALTDTQCDKTTKAGRVLFSPGDERDLFLQYNYARMLLSKHHAIAVRGEMTEDEGNAALARGGRMKLCRDTLVVANLGLVFAMGRQYGIFASSPDVSELVSEGMEALMRSVDRFDVIRGFKFSTYACRSIIQAMNRHKGKCANRLTRESPASWDITPESPVLTHSPSSDELDELRAVLRDNSANLSDAELDVIDRRFFGRGKLHEVGSAMQISKETVRKIQRRAIDKIRIAMSA